MTVYSFDPSFTDIYIKIHDLMYTHENFKLKDRF